VWSMRSIRVRFGRALRALRAKAGHSQDSLAAALQVHHTWISRLDRGDCNPMLATIKKLAQGLDMSIKEPSRQWSGNSRSSRPRSSVRFRRGRPQV
jgi:transcriptional regulator with XRE-family HTH domain